MRLTAAGGELLAGALADVEAADQAYFAVLGRDRDSFGRALRTLNARVVTRPVAGDGAISRARTGRRRR